MSEWLPSTMPEKRSPESNGNVEDAHATYEALFPNLCTENDAPIAGIDDPAAEASDDDVNLEVFIKDPVEDPLVVDENVEIPIQTPVEDPPVVEENVEIPIKAPIEDPPVVGEDFWILEKVKDHHYILFKDVGLVVQYGQKVLDVRYDKLKRLRSSLIIYKMV
ncbi:Hypothetical predicted protein [Olea europaea subsp. europaea]|uniref:Uncharacterized protein n=1 Tax=Olea europaea subsp. europaea TaxID=158383 RepID=A0A8S0S4S0_OLEEU|nr:Hypothetical predicted protein [Olea europaea subsp. europaea]